MVRALAVRRQRGPFDLAGGAVEADRAGRRPDRLQRRGVERAGDRRADADRAGMAETPAAGGVI